jgi:hypothetical protein
MQDQGKALEMEAVGSEEHSGCADVLAIPVWLHANDSFYKKLNRIAKQVDTIDFSKNKLHQRTVSGIPNNL